MRDPLHVRQKKQCRIRTYARGVVRLVLGWTVHHSSSIIDSTLAATQRGGPIAWSCTIGLGSGILSLHPPSPVALPGPVMHHQEYFVPTDPEVVDLLKDIRRAIHELIALAKAAPVATVAQTTCPVCNRPLDAYEGPYTRRTNGTLQHRHHKGEGSDSP